MTCRIEHDVLVFAGSTPHTLVDRTDRWVLGVARKRERPQEGQLIFTLRFLLYRVLCCRLVAVLTSKVGQWPEQTIKFFSRYLSHDRVCSESLG